MKTLLLMLLTATPIDGFQLFARSEASEAQRAHRKVIAKLKEKALAQAWAQSESGIYKAYFCVEDNVTAEKDWVVIEAQRDSLVKALNTVSGLTASKKFHNISCVEMDWSQP